MRILTNEFQSKVQFDVDYEGELIGINFVKVEHTPVERRGLNPECDIFQ